MTNATALADSGGAHPDWPKQLTVTVGDVRTRIDAQKLWTLSGIDYRNTVAAVEDSAYGAVLHFRDDGFLGTAHFLNAPHLPGGIEKEQVIDLSFFLDGQRIEAFEPEMALRGHWFRFERRSSIRGMDVSSSIDLRDGVLLETQRFSARETIDVDKAYPMMYAWTPEATHYLFGNSDSIQNNGVFRATGKSDDTGLEKTADWMAVYSSSTGVGAVMLLVESPPDTNTWLQWTDAPDVYRKLRIMTFTDGAIPQGYVGTYKVALGFYVATDEQWAHQAIDRLGEMRHVVNNEWERVAP